ncbi:MAG: cytochrome c peroxidase [Pseudomonadota bacterium]
MKRALIAVVFAGSLAGQDAASAPATSLDCSLDPLFGKLQDNLPLVRLGRDLFYDPILSGNKTVACATCHHPALGTSDGVALSLGDGGVGLGPDRRADPQNMPEQRIPRNAQSLFNLGYQEFSVLFHDGRVERLEGGLIRTPLGNIPDTSRLSLLAALSKFPVTSADEMAGHYSENAISQAVRRGLIQGPGGAHERLADRVSMIPAYRAQFTQTNGGDTPITYERIALALAAFMAHEWRADRSPFDRHLCSGEEIPTEATAGMKLFYGKAGCSDCHSGRFQTDHGFHAIAMPQIGPGKSERFETHARDIGRMRVTGQPEDAYKFRTPSLRNVALTAPYGHAGAYPDLQSVIRHHLDPLAALSAYDQTQVVLPILTGATDFEILHSKAETQPIADANELTATELSDRDIDQLVAFLEALTDLSGVKGRLGVPKTVPSGLPVPLLKDGFTDR